MRNQLKKRLICLAIPLAVGGLAALLSGGMASYKQLAQPPLSPPGWVFPIVWSILYLLMGEASYRILTSGQAAGKIKTALIAYGVQLLLNFLWPLLFFGQELYLTAFFLLVLLWVAIFVTIRLFAQIDRRAADLLLPYLIWVTFAGYLNFGVYLLN